MARCGICGGKLGRTLVKHGEICLDDKKAEAMKNIYNNEDNCIECGEHFSTSHASNCSSNDETEQEDRVCGACGFFFELQDADNDGYHLAKKCDAYEEQLCSSQG